MYTMKRRIAKGKGHGEKSAEMVEMDFFENAEKFAFTDQLPMFINGDSRLLF